jgi:hypothetical protein
VEVMLAFVLHHFWHVHNFLLVKGMLLWSTFGGLEAPCKAFSNKILAGSLRVHQFEMLHMILKDMEE